MTWRLAHHFAGSTCEWGTRLTWGGLRNRQPTCPKDLGSPISSELGPAVTALLLRRGIDYDPVGPSNALLWCLGGPELYRAPDDVEDLQSDSCLDLNLRVCDEHRTISLELYPYDIVPEWGGSGPDDPTQSEPIDLGDESTAIDEVVALAELWLDEILLLPG